MVSRVRNEVVSEHDDDEKEVDGVDGDQVVGAVHREGRQCVHLPDNDRPGINIEN